MQTNTSTYSYIEPGQRAITFGYEGVYENIAAMLRSTTALPAGANPTLTVFETTDQLALRSGLRTVHQVHIAACASDGGYAQIPIQVARR